MLNRILKQTYFKLLVFSRTPFLYVTTYFIPVFCFYFFGKNNNLYQLKFENQSYVDWYLPIYIVIGNIAISIFTIGMNLVQKREKQLYKRILLTNQKKIESYASDIVQTIILSIPLTIILIIEAIVFFDFSTSFWKILISVPIIVLTSICSNIIAHFIFNLISSSMIASPLQISVFGFSLFALGIIMPYTILSDKTMNFIKMTPYYQLNRFAIMLWNKEVSLGAVNSAVFYLVTFSIILVTSTVYIEKLYDRR
ncbi:ABC transporter permease [Streptococcus salivarius]|uniref:ABC transporter permease n=1 Tax=Streptococcus salivarius TaxID=1304 RepID=UPI000A09255E|nr:ABC transporter permease [Streptococcus salivarius]ARI59912.1 hypothetical protein V471_06620 [Streptococcus salivarius]SQF75711.1 Uncharacterised protein [Streptococcus salivarius]